MLHKLGNLDTEQHITESGNALCKRMFTIIIIIYVSIVPM